MFRHGPMVVNPIGNRLFPHLDLLGEATLGKTHLAKRRLEFRSCHAAYIERSCAHRKLFC